MTRAIEAGWGGFYRLLFVVFSVGIFDVSISSLYAGSITAELYQNRIAAGDSVSLVVVVSGSLKGEIELPEIEGLDIRSAGTSTNIQIVNGSISKEQSYSFMLTPQRVGVFKIPSIQAKVDGENVASLPLTLTVAAAGGGGQVPPSSGGAGTELHGSSGQGDSNPSQNSVPVVVERELAKRELYQDEAIISKVRIMFPATLQIGSLVPERQASPDWRIVSKDGQKNYTMEREGMPWRVTELTEVLIPLKPGKLQAPVYSVRVTYIKPTRRSRSAQSIWDLFNQGMMGGEEVSKKISSAAETLAIKALPQAGRPALPAEMVGVFTLSADVGSRELAKDQTATVTIKLKGLGALDRVAPFRLPSLLGAKIYEEKPQLKEEISERGLESEKTLRFAVVPTVAGTLNLGVIELAAFDPGAAAWRTLKADLGVIHVNAASAEASTPQSPDSQTAGQNASDRSHKSNTSENSITPSQKDEGGPEAKTNHNQNIVPGLKVENHVDGNANVLQGTRKWYLMAAFSVALMFILGAFWLLKTTLRGGPTSRNHWSFTALRRPLAKLTSRDPNSAMQFIAALKQQMEILSPPLQAHAVTARDIAEALRQKGVPEDLLTNLEKAIVNIETAPYRGEPIVEQHIESLKASMEQLLTIRLKA